MFFAAHEVVKQNNELMMTCKAYNGRVVTEWLADALGRCHPGASDPRMTCAFVCVYLDNFNLCLFDVCEHGMFVFCLCMFAWALCLLL